MSRRREISLEEVLDYDLAAYEAAKLIAQVICNRPDDEDVFDNDEDLYVEALNVLKALALDGWLDPARLSIVQIDEKLGEES